MRVQRKVRTLVRIGFNVGVGGLLSVSAGVSAGEFSVSAPVFLRGAAATAPSDATSGASQPVYRLRGGVFGIDEIFGDGFDGVAAWDVTFPYGVTIAQTPVTFASVDVPAGRYVAFVRMQASTGSEPDPGNNYRFDCSLDPSFDYGVYRVGEEPLVERYLTYQGAATLASGGTISFTCVDGNGHQDTELSGKMTVIRVGEAD